MQFFVLVDFVLHGSFEVRLYCTTCVFYSFLWLNDISLLKIYYIYILSGDSLETAHDFNSPNRLVLSRIPVYTVKSGRGAGRNFWTLKTAIRGEAGNFHIIDFEPTGDPPSAVVFSSSSHCFIT